jgi:hypothetical protein
VQSKSDVMGRNGAGISQPSFLIRLVIRASAVEADHHVHACGRQDMGRMQCIECRWKQQRRDANVHNNSQKEGKLQHFLLRDWRNIWAVSRQVAYERRRSGGMKSTPLQRRRLPSVHARFAPRSELSARLLALFPAPPFVAMLSLRSAARASVRCASGLLPRGASAAAAVAAPVPRVRQAAVPRFCAQYLSQRHRCTHHIWRR